ncbi:MAG TPA: MBL fold metallo-hydrolase [Ktedonobacterales bacterium]|nr:MBL fold metallo-hydrolase [Ktedonobacterales bacterium]
MPAMQDALPLEIADLELDSQALHELEPGIWRVPAPVPFGARVVNLYLLGAPVAAAQGSQGWCLVDCPLDTPPAEAALRDALDRIGASPASISAIILTHVHPDHLGAAGRWQRLSGAPVYMLAAEKRDMAPLWGDAANTAFLDVARVCVTHGMPADEAQALVTRAVQLRRLLDLPDHPTLLAHGQRIHLAGAAYRALWTPGHADGHLCLLRDDGVLVAGDAVLPALRPTVGWYPWSRPDPLADQLASLAALGDLPVRLVLPGHGRPFTDLRGRASVLAGSYAREIVTVARLLAEAPDGLTAYALAQALYPERMRNPGSRLVALAESVAFLAHLRILSRAERQTGADGVITYHRGDEGALVSGAVASGTSGSDEPSPTSQGVWPQD